MSLFGRLPTMTATDPWVVMEAWTDVFSSFLLLFLFYLLIIDCSSSPDFLLLFLIHIHTNSKVYCTALPYDQASR